MHTAVNYTYTFVVANANITTTTTSRIAKVSTHKQQQKITKFPVFWTILSIIFPAKFSNLRIDENMRHHAEALIVCYLKQTNKILLHCWCLAE